METNERREDIYRTYRARVLAYARAKAGASFDAEDLTSEIFLKVFRALPDYDPQKASLSTWIYAIARNHIADCFRARRIDSLPYDEERHAETAGEENGEEALLERLDQALETLPERQREIVILRYYFNLSPKEIARRMGLSYTNVRQICFVAVGALRKRIGIAN